MEVRTLHVPKLNSAGVEKIRNALLELPGVERIEFDLEGKHITLTFDENQVGLVALEERIATAGFPVAGAK